MLNVALSVTNRRSLVRSPARLIFFQKIDDSHCHRAHSFFTIIHCFDDGYIGKQTSAWKEYCAKYCKNVHQESKGRCTGSRAITEESVKHQAINQLNMKYATRHNSADSMPTSNLVCIKMASILYSQSCDH